MHTAQIKSQIKNYILKYTPSRNTLCDTPSTKSLDNKIAKISTDCKDFP